MKRKLCFAGVLLLLLCVFFTALAEDGLNEEIISSLFSGPLAVVPPQTGWEITRRAVTVTQTSEGTVPLYALPNERSDILMNYYAGAPLEMIRAADGDFVLVQVGTQEAGLMGYMRAQDIRTDGMAAREVRPCFMRLEFNHAAQVYAYCDEGAQHIGTCEPGRSYYAMGKNDGKWVQLFLPPQPHVWEEEDRMTCGFVRLETGAARGYWQELEQWEIQPAVGELAPEQVIELALEYLDGSGMGGIPDVYTQRAELEGMERRALLRVHLSDMLPVWWVYFWQRRGGDAVYVNMRIGQNGTDMTQGYIAQDDWDGYAVTPVL